MSPQPRQARSTSRAADLAAEQVESIVSAAQESARQLAAAAHKEVESARQEAEQVRVLAREAAKAELDAARKEAAERIAEAQAAADEVLAETKAVSGGMRQLAHLMTTHAERILRDVTNSHRAITADLRAAKAGASSDRSLQPDTPPDDDGEMRVRRGSRPPGRAAAGDNPFADLDPPSWVEEPRGG